VSFLAQSFSRGVNFVDASEAVDVAASGARISRGVTVERAPLKTPPEERRPLPHILPSLCVAWKTEDSMPLSTGTFSGQRPGSLCDNVYNSFATHDA